MSQSLIVPHGESAAIVLSPEMLRQLNLQVGDPVQLTLSGGQLVVSPGSEAPRESVIERICSDLIQTRGEAYRRLA